MGADDLSSRGSQQPRNSAAEEWLEDLVSRVECQFTLFPLMEELDRRTGPTVLEIANALGVRVGSHISDQELLRLIVMLSIITDDFPPAVPKSPGPFGLGYVVTMPWVLDREDYRIIDSDDDDDGQSGPDRVLFVNGGWMYDAVGLDGVSVLHERENWKIVYHTTVPAKFSAVCMPNFTGDFVSFFPHLHDLADLNGQSSSLNPSHAQDEEPTITLVLSNWQSDAFPLLSVSSSTANTPRGALAALIRVECFGRVVETVWKPDVKQGSPCEHKSLWGHSTRCSPTAINLLQQVLPPNSYDIDAGYSGDNSTLFQESDFFISKDISSQRQGILRELIEEQMRRVGPLMKVGSPLERTRVCIVRCGVRDGPVDALVVLAASLKKKVYVLDYRFVSFYFIVHVC